MKPITYLLVLLTGVACTEQGIESSENPYSEQHRPQIHFTPSQMWMNDPNGMVYYEGEYHLFYQHYPDSTVWGPMHWGHAVSKDLVKWEHLPIALYPDSMYVFSGSCVIDWENTTGFGEQGNPPMVAIYTFGLEDDKKIPQRQGIAYSNDKGRTWSKYEGNPVLDEGLRAFRDPKVFWHEPNSEWIMSISATTDNVGIRPNHVRFYGSPDLKTWRYLSEFGHDKGSQDGNWECPDLIEMPVEGSEEKKWVLLVSVNPGAPNGGSGTQYFVGEFDGIRFTSDLDTSQPLWLDYGRDNYAGVTWSGLPLQDGRKIFMGWMSNWQYCMQVPTHPWRSAMTVPRSLSLVRSHNGFRVHSVPVQELQRLRKGETIIENLSFSGVEEVLEVDFASNVFEAQLEFAYDPQTTTIVGIQLSNAGGESYRIGFSSMTQEIISDRTQAGPLFSDVFANDVHVAPIHVEDDRVSFHLLVDKASVELFAGDGAVVMTETFFPSEPFDQVSLFSTDGESLLIRGQFFPLASIWEGEE